MNEELKKVLVAGEIEESVIKKIGEALGDKKVMIDDENFVPLSRIKAKNTEIEKLNEIIEKNEKDITSLKKEFENDDTKEKFAEIERENKKLADQLNKQKIENQFVADFGDLSESRRKALKALFDWEKVKIDGDTITGYEDQKAAIKENEDNSFIFKTEAAGDDAGDAGGTGGAGNFGKGGGSKGSTTNFFKTITENQARKS